MYKVNRVDTKILEQINQSNYYNTVFSTKEWLYFLHNNQKAELVLLEISNNTMVVGYFVGLIVQKFGVRILGSPFEGWLTPDMGFIRTGELDDAHAIESVVKYSFSKLKCHYVQICDKKISEDSLRIKHKLQIVQLLKINIEDSLDDILEGFTKNGRRDIRASWRKEIAVEHVSFDYEFADIYYAQLLDVFAKQGLKPNYSKQKIYDLVDAFQTCPNHVVALEAINSEGVVIATLFSVGMGDWAYYVGAASYRQYQKLLPNEALFWEFVSTWKERGVKYLDLMGYRQYKMKYNPEVVEVPRFMFERIPGLILAKVIANRAISACRKLKGMFVD